MERTSVDEQRDKLLEALADLEASVETPFVPGELEPWIAAVDEAFQHLRPRLDWSSTHVHPQQFDEIDHEDPELMRRVDQMRQEDAAIKEAARQLAEQIPKLETVVSAIEPDEAGMTAVMDEFVQAMLNLIVRVRTQEQAVRTWLMEAFDRDLGAVD